MAQNVWIINRNSEFDAWEQDLFPVKIWYTKKGNDMCSHSNLGEYIKARKTIFTEREKAEEYVLGIVQVGYKYIMKDMLSNAGDDPDEKKCVLDKIKEFEKRGLQKIRCDELKEGDKYYELYGRGHYLPTTTFVIPVEDEYDRTGYFFVEILQEKLN